MEADYSVELGPEAPALELPWADPSGHCQYIDLRGEPERIGELPETADSPALRTFLLAANAEVSPLQSAKCDFWLEELTDDESRDEMAASEGVGDSSAQCGDDRTGAISCSPLSAPTTLPDGNSSSAFCAGGYVDLLFRADESRYSLEHHIDFARTAVHRIEELEDKLATAENASTNKTLDGTVEFKAALSIKPVTTAEFVIRRCYYHISTLDSPSRDGFYCTLHLNTTAASATSARSAWEQALELLRQALFAETS